VAKIKTLLVTGASRRLGRRVVELLADAGADRLLYTSFANPDPRFMVAADHWGTERALAASGLGWTALRHNLYTEYLP